MKTTTHRRSLLKGMLATAAGLTTACSSRLFGPNSGSPRQVTDGAKYRPSFKGIKRTKQALIDYMADLEVIDTHEHLWAESQRVAHQMDALQLFDLYAALDIQSAGGPPRGNYFRKYASGPMSEAQKTIAWGPAPPEPSETLEERWKKVSPYLSKIKYTSYCRATWIALRDLYGIDKLNDNNYREASEKIQAANTPGLYHRILRDRCKIKACLVQPFTQWFYLQQFDQWDPPGLMRPVFGGPIRENTPRMIEFLNQRYVLKINDFDNLLEVLEIFLMEMRSKGAAAFKIYVFQPMGPPNLEGARRCFNKCLTSDNLPATGQRNSFLDEIDNNILEATILDHVYALAGKWDWPISAHTGGADNFYQCNPVNIIQVLKRHPGTRFDLFHMGIPYSREAIFIAKNYPNASLNFCWAYLLSEEICRQAIHEILDTVPITKVHAFGGDYVADVENVYGHLTMARETIAEAFAERIARGKLDMEDARQIARMWLYENPAKFYGIS